MKKSNIQPGNTDPFKDPYGRTIDDDRKPENRIDGIPPHDPPDELKAYFSRSGALNDLGSGVFVNKGHIAEPWFENGLGRELALYVWKVAGGSFKIVGRIMNSTDARARHFTQHARKIAIDRGFMKKDQKDGTILYVETEELGEAMLHTVAALHDRLREMVPAMDSAREVKDALKTMTEMSMLLKGMPTSRAASVSEKPRSESQLRKELAAFTKTIDRIDRKKNFKPANTEVT